MEILGKVSNPFGSLRWVTTRAGAVTKRPVNAGRLQMLIGGLLCFTALAGADTIINGDFSHGNTGFRSDYSASPTCSAGSPFTAGFYFVGTNPANCNGGWVSMSDPTGGGLNMMIVNGATDGTSRVWYETLSTTPNTQYTFTFWMADIYNLGGDSPATLEFSVNGVVVPGCSGYSPTTPGQWMKEVCRYTSGPGSTETLALVDTNTAFEANDFAIDDISDPPAVAVTFTSLASFDGTDGANPQAPLVQTTNGNLYGTTLNGGASPFGTDGTIFKITPGGTLTTLYSFCLQSGCPDGYTVPAGLVQATNGSLYGTTEDGGGCCGTVFRITQSGTLATLDGLPAEDGSGPYPTAGLVQASNGYLYGTTVGGGLFGAGTVFRMTLSGTLTTIFSFCPLPAPSCSSTDSLANGWMPAAGLIQATNGELYGTTFGGGTNPGGGAYGPGTVFKITPSGALTTLYSFCSKSNSQNSCLDGYSPVATLVQATNGYFYGTTTAGGANNAGTIFRMTPTGTLTTLYSFCSQSACADGTQGGGAAPALIQATDGNLYGTAPYGGATGGGTSSIGFGTVFKMTPSGELTTLYTFCIQSGCEDGGRPFGGLVQDTNGTFYGTTQVGGTTPVDGTVFSLSVGLGPFVKTLPTSASVGAAVKILGSDLTGATGVSFNGTAATFSVVSRSEITTKVPAGATSGEVRVTTPSGTLSSNVRFLVLP
jgi:uncharacterized repeat protein (TIGR03803 family)